MLENLKDNTDLRKDLLTVAARIKRMNAGKYPAFVGSVAFKSDLVTLIDLIEKLKEQKDE
jgi:hypothetical protein